MNYLITTTYQNNTYSHIVEGLDSNQIQILFAPDSIVPMVDGDATIAMDDYDLVASLDYQGKQFQIISHIKKVIEFYAWIKSIIWKTSTSSDTLQLNSINSKARPLTDKQAHDLIVKLESQFTKKEQVITATVKKLVEDTRADIADFLVRFKGYTDEKDLDILQTWSHDLEIFVNQGNIAQIRERMEQIITKMELLESNYVKQIDIDKDKPLSSFTKELHTIMNQNRLFRYHGLNQLSGWSKIDFMIYKLLSSWKLWWNAMKMEMHTLQDAFSLIVRQLLHIVVRAILFGLIILYIYKTFVDKSMDYPFIKYGIMGLISMMCYAVAKKQIGVSLTLMGIFVIAGYVSYEFVKVNLGL